MVPSLRAAAPLVAALLLVSVVHGQDPGASPRDEVASALVPFQEAVNNIPPAYTQLLKTIDSEQAAGRLTETDAEKERWRALPFRMAREPIWPDPQIQTQVGMLIKEPSANKEVMNAWNVFYAALQKPVALNREHGVELITRCRAAAAAEWREATKPKQLDPLLSAFHEVESLIPISARNVLAENLGFENSRIIPCFVRYRGLHERLERKS